MMEDRRYQSAVFLAKVDAILGAENPMPDFESVFFGAPYKADVTFRGRRTLLSVDDQFEVWIPSLSKSDSRLATVLADDTQVEFREIEGRLFGRCFAGTVCPGRSTA